MSEKYGESTVAETVRKLTGNAAQVLYGVDATKLDCEQTQAMQDGQRNKFDRIVFNFPHAGSSYETEQGEEQLDNHGRMQKLAQIKQMNAQLYADFL
jgi:hypothetical protein